MDSLHIGHDSGMETGSTSMNSVRERSSCETSCIDSADTYNFTENISSEDEEKITCEYNSPGWTEANFDNSRQTNGDISINQFDNDFTSLNANDNFTGRYTNKCDEYSGRASSSKSLNSEKCTPKHKPMELVVSHSSQTLILKSSSRVMSDEHDTFSPEEDLSFIRHEESAAMTPDDFLLDDAYLIEDQNKKYDQSLYSVVSKSSTKEEKQRQNEEIVNLESSSISSETGSWESVFPMRSNQEIRDMCATFLLNEKDFCSRDIKSKISQQLSPKSKHSTPIKHNACFIDASSLIDDEEVFVTQPVEWKTNCSESSINSSFIKPTALNFTERKTSNPINIFKPDKFQNEITVSKSTGTIKKYIRCEDLQSSSSSYPEQNGVDFFEEQDLDFHTRFEKCKLNQTSSMDNAEGLSEHLNTFSNNLHENDRFTLKPTSLTNEVQILNKRSTTKTNSCNEIENLEKQENVNSKSDILEVNVLNKNNLENTVILPDTPHNSIVEIVTEHSKSIDSPYKAYKFSEASPIISGGASAQDFAPKTRGSPMVRRKLDSTPILSGAVANDSNEQVSTEKLRRHANHSAWVVDMSDCSSTSSLDSKVNHEEIVKSRRDSTSSHKSSLGFFIDFGDKKSRKEQNDNEDNRIRKIFDNKNEQKNVNLNENKNDNFSDDNKERNSTEEKRSLGYFIDLSQNVEEPLKPEPPEKSKNMFSMFIDFGEKCVKSIPDRLATSLQGSQRARSKSIAVEVIGDKNGMAKSLMQDNINSSPKLKHYDKKIKEPSAKKSSDDSSKGSPFVSLRNLDEVKTTIFSNEKNGKTDGLFQVCRKDKINLKQLKTLDFGKEIANKTNDNDEINCKKNNCHGKINENNDINKEDNFNIFESSSNSKNSEPNKRHSWNITEIPKQTFHKRTQSVSENNILQSEMKMKVGSTYSIDSNLSDFSGRSGFSSGSSSGYARISDINKKHKKDCKINETFDKSSPGSQTEGVLTDTDEDLTYQNEQNPEEICMSKETNYIIKDIEQTKPEVKIGYTLNLDDNESIKNNKKNNEKVINSVAHTMETLQAKIEKQKQLLATVSENTEMHNENLKTMMTDSGKFVRLSDLDKPSPKMDLINEKLMSNSTGSNRIYKLFATNYENKFFMSRSIGNHTNLITSEENSRSLSRLFPHLSKGFSSSLPNGVNANSHFNRSPLEFSDFTSDISAGSSLSSNLSTEDSLSRQPRRLGEDLLRMFLEEISPDVSIDVSGRVLRAHKCILRSRCQYFAATLAGNEVETRGNVIVMDGYTYGAVHFALCHIYSGATRPPEGISLQELASLADLLGLEGLKEVTAHALKSTYCHMFHKPCDECISGVCLVLPLAAGHGLDELHARCVRWLCRHFLKVWPTKSFASLSNDLMERARRHIIAHLTAENVLGTVLDCECLLSELPEARWAGRVEALTLSLLEHAHMFVADKFPSILTASSFLSLGSLMWRNVARLRTTLNEAASSLAPEQACRSYHRLTRLGSLVKGGLPISDPVKGSPIYFPKNQFGENLTENTVNQPQIENGVPENMALWHPEFANLVEQLTSSVEQCLAKQGSRATRAISWSRLEPKLRRRIQELMTANGNSPSCGTSNNDLRNFPDNRNKIPRSVRSASSTRTQDLKEIRQVIHANAAKTFSQENKKYYENNLQSNDSVSNTVIKQKIKKIHRNVLSKNYVKNLSNEQKPNLEKNFVLKTIKKTTGEVIKSSSNKSIPTDSSKANKVSGRDISRPIIGQGSNRPRSQSEIISKTNKSSELKSLSARVAHAKPRYLEPRKRDLEQTSNKKNQNMKNKLLSSSETSRTPSPRNRNMRKGESSNMSLDSLASSQKLKTISTDSLTPTMDECDNRLSGVKTKTQENKLISIDTKIKAKPLKLKNTQKIPVRTNIKLSRTLTSPTKSSAAKAVPTKKKVVTEKKIDLNHSIKEEKSIPQKIIPQMERSGTFIKELATE